MCNYKNTRNAINSYVLFSLNLECINYVVRFKDREEFYGVDVYDQ